MGLHTSGSTIMPPSWGFLNFNHYILSNKFDSPNLPPQYTKHGMTNKKNNIPNLHTSKLQTTKCQIHLFPRLSVSLSLRRPLALSHHRLIAHSPTRKIALSLHHKLPDTYSSFLTYNFQQINSCLQFIQS